MTFGTLNTLRDSSKPALLNRIGFSNPLLHRWEYLTEKIAYERRTREAKLQAALQITKRQNAEFAELVEKAKTDKHVEERKRKRQIDDVVALEDSTGVKSGKGFHQVRPIADNYGDTEYSVVGKETLKKIFNSKSKDR